MVRSYVFAEESQIDGVLGGGSEGKSSVYCRRIEIILLEELFENSLY